MASYFSSYNYHTLLSAESPVFLGNLSKQCAQCAWPALCDFWKNRSALPPPPPRGGGGPHTQKKKILKKEIYPPFAPTRG